MSGHVSCKEVSYWFVITKLHGNNYVAKLKNSRAKHNHKPRGKKVFLIFHLVFEWHYLSAKFSSRILFFTIKVTYQKWFNRFERNDCFMRIRTKREDEWKEAIKQSKRQHCSSMESPLSGAKISVQKTRSICCLWRRLKALLSSIISVRFLLERPILNIKTCHFLWFWITPDFISTLEFRSSIE